MKTFRLADGQISSSTENNDLFKKMLDFIKIKTFFSWKVIIRKTNRQVKEWEKVFAEIMTGSYQECI